MKMKKLLSMLLTLCIVLTTIGTMSIAAGAETVTIDKAIIVAKGIEMPLPATITSATDSSAKVDVTWKNSKGEIVTNADTSCVGYRIYTGTTADETPRTLTYRVNVGEEFRLLAEDGFDTYTNTYASTYDTFEEFSKAELSSTIVPNLKFDKSAYNDSGTGTSYSQRFEKVGENTVVAFGPHISDWTAIKWTPTANNDYQSHGDYFRISLDVKVTNLPWSTYSAKAAIMQMNIHNCEGWTLRADKNSDGTMKETQFRINKTGQNFVIPESLVSWSDVDANGNIAMNDYITMTIEGNDIVASAIVGNTLIGTGNWYGQSGVNYDNLVHHIQLANRVNVGQTVYLDNMKYSKLIYVSDTLEDKAVTEKLSQNASAAQTTTVDLTMSDGSTKNFTVNYTADTSAAGENKIAQGTIDGFDGTIPVTYSVVGVENKTINTYIGADVTLADGTTKADTTAFGRKYYEITTEDGIINYTVNVGRYDSKVTDNMEDHTEDTFTSGDKSITTIKSGSADGLNLKVTNTTSASEYSATVVEQEGNKWIKFDKYTPSNHLIWEVVDGFEGDGRVSVEAKTVGVVDDNSPTGAYIRIYDTNGVQMTHAFAPRFYENDIKLFIMNDSSIDNAVDTNALKWYDAQWGASETISGTEITTEPFVITFDFHTDSRTYDVMVNGVVYDKFQGLPFSCNEANGNIGAIRIINRSTTPTTDYFDNLTVSQYNCFTGALPENVNLVVGAGEAAPQSVKVPLTLSNGAVIEVDATVNADTSNIAKNVSAKAALNGFDDEVNATVDVSNYYIDTIGYTKGNEFTTAPLAGGKVSSITLISKSGRNKEEKAVAAWFDGLNNIKAVKSVTIPAMQKGEKATVKVDMELPSVVDGGKLKIFILDSIGSLIPIDFVEEVSAGISAAPTVYMVGDSTMCDYPIKTNTQWPKTGVGMVLGDYFDAVTVNNNYANSGESTETFISEGWWNGVVNNLKVGDYVIISLGHNDQGNCETKHPNDCVYKKNLQTMLDEANEKGANVIFYSPIRRQHEADMVAFPDPFGSHYYTVKHSHYKDMADLVTEGKAAGKSVSYIDMTKISGEMLEGKTSDEQKEYYVADAGINTSVYSSHEYWTISTFNGQEAKAAADTSHYNVFGAKTYARRIADEIKALDIILSDYVNNTAVTVYPGF